MSDNEPQAPGATPPHPDPDAPATNRRRRLLFRATHRGTHECDLLIGGYVARRLASLSEAEMDALEEVMELPDSDLADWLTGRLPIPPEADSPMLRAIRAAAEAGESQR
ncbi:MAG: succinate dehydrogenase assembly factor 2 [Rhodospirillales bacterium]|nr:succinate dehydrogenase assembly factor 2 [Rhodospirillales bacterium]